MGLLSEGSPLSWVETKALAEHVKKHGICQFLNQYHRLKDRTGDTLLWGDERASPASVQSLISHDLPRCLPSSGVPSLWRPEYGAYMIEGTPGRPYGGSLACLRAVECNMRKRRAEATAALQPDEVLIALTAFPRLGCPGSTNAICPPNPMAGVTRSIFLPDEVTFPGHPRFKTLARNIRERRGEKVVINVPIFRDQCTPRPFRETLDDPTGESLEAALDDHVYMDAMAFGMGCSCLQVTFQACCIDEGRTLYDQLAPLCPIMLALTAACPMQRGYLTDRDCRWDVISASVDCRTRGERGLEPLKPGEQRIPKSRYDSISSYLSPQGEKYCDIDLPIVKPIFEQLVDAGVDKLLAQHIAHIFIRDPVSLFSERVDQDDTKELDHFENIQSTNWQTMRFKIPPPSSSIGWRVEFRPMEVQLTDFENAAYVIFIVLLTRVILKFNLNLIIPISKVDENMKRAQERDAVRKRKFWFRRDFQTSFTTSHCNGGTCPKRTNSEESLSEETSRISSSPQTNSVVENGEADSHDDEEYMEMTIDEIINGRDKSAGLVELVNNYIDTLEVDAVTRESLTQYLDLIRRRASGRTLTTASWMRKQVLEHPEYQRDSVVSDSIAYDLIEKCHAVSTGGFEPTFLMQNVFGRPECNGTSSVERKGKCSKGVRKCKKKAAAMIEQQQEGGHLSVLASEDSNHVSVSATVLPETTEELAVTLIPSESSCK
ncbi:unnamed protein product [Cyprideis torosa]|uniref:Glutamate--cysteine ligase n=1 Tax=Cyprideis torosa TaxID=163714 RepID=A0A7R8ZPY6_9CRUS|nr:unnamed protein product [Cyprideis torosa]CAG0895094.1 unnamed protein product [Cyprideis torosa]